MSSRPADILISGGASQMLSELRTTIHRIALEKAVENARENRQDTVTEKEVVAVLQDAIEETVNQMRGEHADSGCEAAAT